MERQKTKWRFQNIAIVCSLFALMGGNAQVSRADVDDDGIYFDYLPQISLQAKARFPVSGGAPLPGLKGSFADFKLPDEERFWELHGLKMTPELRRAVQRLSEHLVGTARERAAAFKYCDARKEALSKRTSLIMTPDGVACLYYRWQSLMRERQAQIVLTKEKPSHGKVAHKTSRRGKKSSAPASVTLQSTRDLMKLLDVPYRTALKKVEFRSLSAALRGAQVAQELPKDCRFASVRAAVIRDLENFLPTASVWDAMNQVYDVTAPCLAPTHEAFEVVNGRLALLHLERKLFDRAASLLELALQGKALEEESHLLFWRGFIDTLQTPADGMRSFVQGERGEFVKITNVYWERLIEKYPLTLHALVADHMSGNDPYERYENRPQPSVSVYEGNEWNLENVSHLMGAIYMLKGKKVELEKITRLLDEGLVYLSFESAMFRLKMFAMAEQPRAIIKTISQTVKQFGSRHLCTDLLSMLYPVKFRNEIAEQAAFIDPALIFSLIRQESSFNPKATSPVGARGLMQVMPATARKLDRRRNLDLYDPDTNIRIGSKYLHFLRNKHKGDYSRLIASYNAGPNNTLKWDDRYKAVSPLLFADLIPFPETRHYVSGLMRHMYWYRSLVSHVKETSGATKINWSWSLDHVVPRREQFALSKNQMVQIRIEALPWLPEQSRQSSADSTN